MIGYELAAGAVHLPAFLDVHSQRSIADQCRRLIEGDTPAYVPMVRGGGRMHVRMLCLGRHWNAQMYRYEATPGKVACFGRPPRICGG
jgi:alkylated DNA repair protein (DNA oxidative demethylase)